MTLDPQPSSRPADRVAAFVEALMRVVRTGALYGAEHPKRMEMVGRLEVALGPALGEGTSLTFQVTPGGLLVDESQIATEDAIDLSRRLASGGLDTLELHAGIATHELDGLAELLTLDFERLHLDEDLSTLLWEREWAHVRWEAVEVPTRPATKEEQSSFNSTVPQQRLPDPLTPDDVTAVKIALDEQEQALLATEVAAHENPPTNRQVGGILCQLIGLETNRDHLGPLLEILRSLVDAALRDGRFAEALEIFELMNAFKRDSGAMTEEKVRGIAGCQASFSTADAMATVAPILESGRWDDPDRAVQYLSGLGSEASRHLLETLFGVQSGDGRVLLRQALAHHLRRDMAWLKDRLSTIDGPALIEVVSLLREVGTKDSVPLLNEILLSAPTDLRLDIVDALERIGGAHARSVLARSLGDPVGEVRCRAARALPTVGAREALEPLLKEMLREDFRERDLEERLTFFRALGATNVSEVLPFIRKLLSQKGWWKRQRVEEDKQCAATALAMMTHPEAEALKAELMASGSQSVQDTLRGAGPERGAA